MCDGNEESTTYHCCCCCCCCCCFSLKLPQSFLTLGVPSADANGFEAPPRPAAPPPLMKGLEEDDEEGAKGFRLAPPPPPAKGFIVLEEPPPTAAGADDRAAGSGAGRAGAGPCPHTELSKPLPPCALLFCAESGPSRDGGDNWGFGCCCAPRRCCCCCCCGCCCCCCVRLGCCCCCCLPAAESWGCGLCCCFCCCWVRFSVASQSSKRFMARPSRVLQRAQQGKKNSSAQQQIGAPCMVAAAAIG